MTDTTDYISYKPEIVVEAFDPNAASPTVVNFGDVTPTRMLVDVTLPLGEQEKLPVFQDIMILMTVHWTSATYATP